MVSAQIKDRLLRPVGSRIKQKREESGLTQVELAALLDVSQPLISRIERGQIDFDAVLLFRLSQTFRVPLKYWVMEVKPSAVAAFAAQV